jgi:hypothetical protein
MEIDPPTRHALAHQDDQGELVEGVGGGWSGESRRRGGDCRCVLRSRCERLRGGWTRCVPLSLFFE